MEYLIFLFLLIVGGGIFLLWKFRPRKLDEKTIQKFSFKIDQTRGKDPEHAIIQIHKLFILALKEMSPASLPAARMIKRHQKRFSEVSQIWKFHRLRNQLAHEIGIKVTEKDAEKARQVFINALRELGKK